MITAAVCTARVGGDGEWKFLGVRPRDTNTEPAEALAEATIAA